MTSAGLGPPQPVHTVPWMRQGTHLFVSALAGHGEDVRVTSRLPGWDVAHVAAHLARNADALGRLVVWAATGRETPMYAGPEQRTAEIEEGSHQTAPELSRDVRTTARTLDGALDSLSDAAWTALVRSAKGRTIPATEIPWLRVREVWLHAIDIGADAAELPRELMHALLDDATTIMSAAPEAPSVRLRATDSDRVRVLGQGTSEVSGPTLALLLWITGRASGAELDTGPAGLPPLPPLL